MTHDDELLRRVSALDPDSEQGEMAFPPLARSITAGQGKRLRNRVLGAGSMVAGIAGAGALYLLPDDPARTRIEFGRPEASATASFTLGGFNRGRPVRTPKSILRIMAYDRNYLDE